MKIILANFRLVISLIVSVFCFLPCNLNAQEAIPLVYDVENTGASFPEPSYPSRDELPFIEQLTDPLLFSDGSGRATDFSQWSRRRS